MSYLDIEERKFNIVKDVQSKGHVSSWKVAYHLLRTSENLPERLKEQYIGNKIYHPLLMQHEIFRYSKKKFNIVKDFQSKGHVNSFKVAYHFPRISEKGFKRFSEQYSAIKIHHPLIMQHEIFGY